jgi:hypothetical protein
MRDGQKEMVMICLSLSLVPAPEEISCHCRGNQRILRFTSGLPLFKDFVFDLSGFGEKSVIGRNDRVSSQIDLRRIDGAMTVVKAISLSALIELCHIETEIDNLLNLHDPVIAPLIGCVFPVESN